MKKILVLIMCLVLTSPLMATDSSDVTAMMVTTEQLKQHINSLYQLLDLAHELMVYEETGVITLTAEQKTALLAQYNTIKSLIASTYAELP